VSNQKKSRSESLLVSSGVGLIELIITFTVLTILVLSAVLDVSAINLRQQLRSDAEIIKKIIQAARIYAVSHASSCNASLTSTMLHVVCAPPQLTTESSINTFDEKLLFNSKNLACEKKELTLWERGSSTASTLCLENKGGSCSVIISLRGRTTLKCY
jgi:Tfp pilus assembly protein FimT